MGKKKTNQAEEVQATPQEYSYTFTDTDRDYIWTFDRSKNPFGPISVETIYKNEPVEVKKKKRTTKKTTK